VRARQIKALAVAVTLLVVPMAGARAGGDTPGGYTVVSRQTLAPGLEYVQLKSGTPERVHVAHLSPGTAARLKVVESGNRISQSRSALERPDALCRRVKCQIAINGDFIMKSGQPYGGVITGGVMMRSPAPGRVQAWVDDNGRLGAGGLGFSGRMEDGAGLGFDLAGVNVDRVKNAVTLYTPAYGSKTPNASGVVELVARAQDAGQIGRLGVPAALSLVDVKTEGGTKIQPGTVVISAAGTGKAAVQALWNRRGGSAAKLRLATLPSVRETIGVQPVVLAGGRRVFANSGSFYTHREPRTLLAWNGAGDVWFVTVDGRQSSSKGWSLAEAAQFVADLGASDAVNFDGGGGTTFVVRGKVMNSPSDNAKNNKPGSVRKAVNAFTAIS
jgi:hypothetical protein